MDDTQQKKSPRGPLILLTLAALITLGGGLYLGGLLPFSPASNKPQSAIQAKANNQETRTERQPARSATSPARPRNLPSIPQNKPIQAVPQEIQPTTNALDRSPSAVPQHNATAAITEHPTNATRPTTSVADTANSTLKNAVAANVTTATNSTRQETSTTMEFSRGRSEKGDQTKVQGRVSTKIFHPDKSRLASMEDPIIRFAFCEFLATYLVHSYWPQGTHPDAATHSITTASLKGINTHYGTDFTGIKHSPKDILHSRSRFFAYLDNPDLIKQLYALYVERFFTTLQARATQKQIRPGNSDFVLSAVDLENMFRLYGNKCHALAQAISAYTDHPEVKEHIQQLLLQENHIAVTSQAYLQAMQGKPADQTAISAYQRALSQKERYNGLIVSSLRRGGDTKALDTNSLSYLALWLYRRGDNALPTLSALVNCLEDAALRFEQQAELIQLRQNQIKKQSPAAN